MDARSIDHLEMKFRVIKPEHRLGIAQVANQLVAILLTG